MKSIAQIASHLAKTAIGPDDKLLPKAQFQIDVRSNGSRKKILEDLILEVCPEGVNPDVWNSWLRGGRSPFIGKPAKAGHASERPNQTLTRATSRVDSQEKKIAALRQNLESEERQLAFVKAYENAAIHWYVVDQLVEIMEPAFALGPAWTIMRSLTSYVSDEAADRATDIYFGEEKIESLVWYRKIRERDTKAMFDTLDWFSGYEPFEEAIRNAVLKVCKDFESRREEASRDGRRPRSEHAMKTSAHPRAQHDADEIIAGLDLDR
jgi:hypothetical protein